MPESHRFSIKLEQDEQSERRFRWIIYEGETARAVVADLCNDTPCQG
jgi:hypothetical protein